MTYLGSHGRLASQADFVRFYGIDPPAEWFGVLGERDGVILGMGSVVWDKWGRPWLFFNRGRSAVSAVAMHRLAKWVMRDLRTTFDENIVHAFCDQTISGAENWLRRLGFKPAPEMEGPVMIWTAQCQD